MYLTVKKDAQEVSAPTNAAVSMGTKPQAGVMPTRPAIMPEQKPMMENLRVKKYSNPTQARPPPEAARLVLQTMYIDRIERFAVEAPKRLSRLINED